MSIYSLRSRRLQVVGERDNGCARGRHASSRARVFSCAHYFQAPAAQASQFTEQQHSHTRHEWVEV